MSLLVVGALSALLAAGCGGEQNLQPAPGPRLPADVASRLAAASDAVAVALDRGDLCAARHRASALAASVETTIGAGQVPLALRPELRRRVQALAAAIHCILSPSPAPVTPTTTTADQGKQSGGDDKHGHHPHDEGGKGKRLSER